jgi:hypothetical protein
MSTETDFPHMIFAFQAFIPSSAQVRRNSFLQMCHLNSLCVLIPALSAKSLRIWFSLFALRLAIFLLLNCARSLACSMRTFCLALVFGGLPEGLGLRRIIEAAWSITRFISLRAVLSPFAHCFSYVFQSMDFCHENSFL